MVTRIKDGRTALFVVRAAYIVTRVQMSQVSGFIPNVNIKNYGPFERLLNAQIFRDRKAGEHELGVEWTVTDLFQP